MKFHNVYYLEGKLFVKCPEEELMFPPALGDGEL
jgi:hypothetical protein